MQSLTLPSFTLGRARFNRTTLLRGVAAGAAWGIVVSGALLVLSFHRCGAICLAQIVETTLLAVLAGIVAIGPVAALRHAQPSES